METMEEEMKRLIEENLPLEIENKELREEVRLLEDASFSSPETSARLQAKLRTAKDNYHKLKDLVERQEEEIKVAQPRRRAALKKSEEEKSLLEEEVETLCKEIEILKDTFQQMQLQRKNALNDLTPEERYIYRYILQHKGTVDIAHLMKKTGYTADDIFRIFQDLESKGLVSRNWRDRRRKDVE